MNKRWTQDDEEFVLDNYGKMSLEDMAVELRRTVMSVRLYILRKRFALEPKVRRNLLQALLKVKFRHPEDFSPTKTFYKEVGISQRRFWDLYFGRKPITGEEYASIAEYLGVTIQEAFESRQLNLFEEHD